MIRGKLWRALHAETDAEAMAILEAETTAEEPVRREQIDEMLAMRQSMIDAKAIG